MVSVAVPALALVIFTGLVEPKLNVGGFWAPAGLDVIAAVSVTLPVKPPLGVTVIVEVLPVFAPGLTDTVVPATVKVGGTATVTVTAGDVEGTSLAPSPLKQATTLGVPAPSWAPVIPDKEAVELQLVVQAVAGTRFADPNAVPVQDEPG